MKKFLETGLWGIIIASFLFSLVYAKDNNKNDDANNGKYENKKIRLVSVSDTPDPFSARVTTAALTADFEVKRVDGLGAEEDEKEDDDKFRFYIEHTWVIVNAQTNQEVVRLVSEKDVVPPPRPKNKNDDNEDDDDEAKHYFPVSATQSWNGLNRAGQLVDDGLYQYTLTGKLYRARPAKGGEKPEEEENEHGFSSGSSGSSHSSEDEDDDKIKLIGISNSLSGTILIDNTPPTITDLTPWPDAILNNPRPLISANYNDTLAGIDQTSVKFWLDNVDLITTTNVTLTGLSYTPPADLPDGAHTAIVEIKDLAGNPAQATWGFMTDITPPEISNLTPAPDSILNNPKPQISADYLDRTSGIDVSAAQIFLDGIDLTNQAAVSAANISLIPQTNLSDGIHTVKIKVKDRAGNPAEAAWSFTTDITPPVITNPSPVPDSYVKNKTPSISADWSDNLSGIDLTSSKILVDNVDFTPSAQITESNFTFTPSEPLSEGLHTINVDVSDKAGNPATQFKWSFTVDTVPPTITVINPPNGSTIDTNTLEIVISYSDETSGLNPATFNVLINGVDKTAFFTITETEARYQIPETEKLPEGDNSITAQIEDKTGNIGLTISSFTVTTAPVDVIPPEVWIEYPLGRNQPAGKTIPITVKARDNVAVTRVTLFANGPEIAADTEAPYEFSYTIPTTLAGKRLELIANAENHVGNIGTSSPVRLSVVSIPSGPFAFEVIGVSDPVVAGTPLNVTVRAIDKNGNTVTNFTGYVYFYTSDGKSSIRWKVTYFSYSDRGVKTVSLPALVTAGDPFIEAFWSSNWAVNGAQTGIDVLPSTLSTVVVEHPLKIITAGQEIDPFIISPADTYGNPIPGIRTEVDIIQLVDTAPFQQHFSITSDEEGKAYTAPIIVFDKTKSIEVRVSLPDYPGIPAVTKTFSVKANVLVNVSLQNNVVQAGVPTGFTLTVRNPDGTIATDFEGTVYVYGYYYFGWYEESITTYDPARFPWSLEAKWIVVNFTAEDHGVKTISDGLVFLFSGIQYIGASTTPPTNLGPYSVFQLDWEILNGLSNDLTVLSGEPARIRAGIYFSPPYYWSSINNNNAIVQCSAGVDDAFGNPVFDQILKFDFWVTGDITSVAYNRTDVWGSARAFGPQLPVTKDQIVAQVTVSAPGTNVPPYTAARTRYALPLSASSTFTYMDPVTPVTVFPNQNNQPARDVSVRMEGRMLMGGNYWVGIGNGYFEIVLPLRLDQANFSTALPAVNGSGMITPYGFSYYDASRGQYDLKFLTNPINLEIYDKTYSADRTILYVKYRNITPLSITYTDINGNPVTTKDGSLGFPQIDTRYATTGLKVDVPASYGEITAVAIPFQHDYRKSGRDYYNAASGIIAVVENLQPLTYQWRVILQDADNIANGLLVPYYDLARMENPTVFYAVATAATNPGTVTIQSFKKDGSAFTDTQGNILSGSRYENVPLSDSSWRYVYRSEPLIAVNYYPPATDTVKVASGSYTIEAGSVVRADGISKSDITITLKDAAGLPLANQFIQIAAGGGAVFEPAVNSLATDQNGMATVGLKSYQPGTKVFTATIDQTTLTAQVLFIQDVIPVLAESGGKIKVTCPELSAANREKTLDVEGVEIEIKETPTQATVSGETVSGGTYEIRATDTLPADGQSRSEISIILRDESGHPKSGVGINLEVSGSANTIIQPVPTDAGGVTKGYLSATIAEMKTITVTGIYSFNGTTKYFEDVIYVQFIDGFRPANYAIIKGINPQVALKFTKSYQVGGMFNPEDMAISLDDGYDETSTDRPIDPAKRFIRMKDYPAEFTFDGERLIWRPAPASPDYIGGASPFNVGTNRIRVWWAEDSHYESAFYGGYLIATAEMLNYTENEIGTDEEIIRQGNTVQENFSSSDKIIPLLITNEINETEKIFVVKDWLRIIFKTDTPQMPSNETISDNDISEILRRRHFRPKGLERNKGAVSIKLVYSGLENDLIALKQNLPFYHPEIVSTDFVYGIETVRERLNHKGSLILDFKNKPIYDIIETALVMNAETLVAIKNNNQPIEDVDLPVEVSEETMTEPSLPVEPGFEADPETPYNPLPPIAPISIGPSFPNIKTELPTISEVSKFRVRINTVQPIAKFFDIYDTSPTEEILAQANLALESGSPLMSQRFLLYDGILDQPTINFIIASFGCTPQPGPKFEKLTIKYENIYRDIGIAQSIKFFSDAACLKEITDYPRDQRRKQLRSAQQMFNKGDKIYVKIAAANLNQKKNAVEKYLLNLKTSHGSENKWSQAFTFEVTETGTNAGIFTSAPVSIIISDEEKKDGTNIYLNIENEELIVVGDANFKIAHSIMVDRGEFGAEYQQVYPADYYGPLTYTKSFCEGLRDEILRARPNWTVNFMNGDKAASNTHWLTTDDKKWVDAVDIAVFAGHGPGAYIVFINKTEARIEEMIFGDHDVDWVVFYTCNMLTTSTGNLKNALQGGAHLLQGYQSTMLIQSRAGTRFGEYLTGKYEPPQTFQQSWARQANDFKDRKERTVTTFGLNSALTDQLPGDGNLLSPDYEAEYKISATDKNTYQLKPTIILPK
ncbi:MAG: Ig-like domain-containing protein [Planctomycetota bacterium]